MKEAKLNEIEKGEELIDIKAFDCFKKVVVKKIVRHNGKHRIHVHNGSIGYTVTREGILYYES